MKMVDKPTLPDLWVWNACADVSDPLDAPSISLSHTVIFHLGLLFVLQRCSTVAFCQETRRIVWLCSFIWFQIRYQIFDFFFSRFLLVLQTFEGSLPTSLCKSTFNSISFHVQPATFSSLLCFKIIPTSVSLNVIKNIKCVSFSVFIAELWQMFPGLVRNGGR